MGPRGGGRNALRRICNLRRHQIERRKRRDQKAKTEEVEEEEEKTKAIC